MDLRANSVNSVEAELLVDCGRSRDDDDDDDDIGCSVLVCAREEVEGGGW